MGRGRGRRRRRRRRKRRRGKKPCVYGKMRRDGKGEREDDFLNMRRKFFFLCPLLYFHFSVSTSLFSNSFLSLFLGVKFAVFWDDVIKLDFLDYFLLESLNLFFSFRHF